MALDKAERRICLDGKPRVAHPPHCTSRARLGLLNHGSLAPLNDKAANLLRIALSNSERLLRLINDILEH